VAYVWSGISVAREEDRAREAGSQKSMLRLGSSPCRALSDGRSKDMSLIGSTYRTTGVVALNGEGNYESVRFLRPLWWRWRWHLSYSTYLTPCAMARGRFPKEPIVTTREEIENFIGSAVLVRYSLMYHRKPCVWACHRSVPSSLKLM
jgi:hypothetical protein